MSESRLREDLVDALAQVRRQADSTASGPLRESASLGAAEIERGIAELGSDLAFVIRVDENGCWQQEWTGGSLFGRPDSPGASVEMSAWERFVLPVDRDELIAHFAAALRTGSDRTEYRVHDSFLANEAADGESVGSRDYWIESAIRVALLDDAPGAVRIYGSIRDVTKRRATEDALRKSESEHRALVEQASDGIFVLDEEGLVEASNPAGREILDIGEDALEARPITDFLDPDDAGGDPHALEEFVFGRTIRSVRRLHRTDGAWVWAELSARRLSDGRIQVTARDITSRIQAEKRIRSLAYFDSLTGLPNRDLFLEHLEFELGRARRNDRPLALLFLDIDRFKHVNDSLGHSSGDALLKAVGERLRGVVRGSDPVGRDVDVLGVSDAGSAPVSRLGGDEFTVLIPGLEHPQDAARVARRVLHALSRPYDLSDQEIFTGCSIGIAVWPDDGETSELLLRSADTAMYHAKKRGGNAYEYFNDSMNQASSRRLSLETRMRRALERDEFKLVYQPIRDSASGRVLAAEALLRWVDSDGLVVGPDEFIPIAEETGLIVEIGAWVLRTACRQSAQWQAEGFEPIRMSVNVSVGQLRDEGIVRTVEEVLIETGLSAQQLELEITESSILDENPNITAAVFELTSQGIGFALDDFGTGYSSLSALQRFPIERLKIDRTFVAGVGQSRSDEALTSAILALAKRLDHKVVAEGVEEEGQARFLQDLGCDELQGYLFSRPVSAQAFEPFLRRSDKPPGERSKE